MKREITLPRLEASLGRLAPAQSLALAKHDIERLFGFNDVADARMSRFASGQHCSVSHADSCVIFQKLPTPSLPSTGA